MEVGDWVEATNDTGEIMLVFRYEALNLRNGVNPHMEEGEEGYGAVVLR